MASFRQYPAFNDQKLTLLCLTTLRHRRFVEDVINLVGLPSGARVRLRYRQSYVSREVLSAVDSGHSGEIQVLIALGASSVDGISRIAPMRSGRVVLAMRQGELFILDVALGAFIFESEPSGHFGAEIGGLGLELPEHFRSDTKAPGKYVNFVKGPITTLLAGEDVRSWEKVAKGVLEQDDLLHKDSPCIPFTYLLSGLPAHVQNALKNRGDLVIDSGSKLSVDLHSLARSNGDILHNPIGEILLEVSHPAASFATSRRLRVDSPRDMKRVQLFGSTLFRRARGHLSLRVVKFESNGEDEPKCSAKRPMSKNDRIEVVIARYDAPLIIGRWRPVVASASLALSTAALAWEAPSNGASVLPSLMVPAIVGTLAFFALSLGFWKDSSA